MTRELKLATADSRMSRLWENSIIDWDTLVERLADPNISHATVAQYHAMPKARQGDIKDVGGFVGGHLAMGLRRKGNVLARSLLSMDLDTPTPETLAKLPELLPCAWVMYSTHSHTPEAPRVRVIIPLARDVDADEYSAISRRVAADIGIDAADDTTHEAHRLMYWPSRPIDGEYLYRENAGPWLDPDAQLARYDDWRDISTWPTSSRQTEALRSRADKQADPLDKPGLVGAFCRTYPIATAITTFLPEVYEPTTGGRFTFIAGESTAGVQTYDDRFAYSHHGTDPAGGQLLNAFDLVRIHRYGTWDEDAKAGTPTHKLPSYRAMTDLAQADKQVARLLATERVTAAAEEFGDAPAPDDVAKAVDWMEDLETNRSGAYVDSLDNLVAILRNDPKLAEIRYNRLAESIDVRDPDQLPWRQIKDGWADTDIAQLKLYIEQRYNLYSSTKTAEALAIAAGERAYHPVLEYLAGLPEWDGTPRVDTLFVDYLGAPDTEYVRAVTRKTLVAAIRRVKQPGCKFDTVLILNGPQGTGKSTLFARLAGAWFSDALTLTDMRDKTGAEKLQGYWILELGELAGMRKMEVETVKGFLSRTDDKYRAAYARTVESHPRQCIIVGSTNAENGFLRDVTGNRRFWPVPITGDTDKRSWNLSDADVAQVWAEALHHHDTGEPLHLTGELAEQARAEQDKAIETDERVGLVEAYLDTPLPENWDEMTLHQRRTFLGGGDIGEFGAPAPTDGGLRRTVCNAEIWAECFGMEPAAMQQRDAYAIAAIMQKLPGWQRKSGDRERIPIYGRQRLYERQIFDTPF